jgi:hypothetical protein
MLGRRYNQTKQYWTNLAILIPINALGKCRRIKVLRAVTQEETHFFYRVLLELLSRESSQNCFSTRKTIGDTRIRDSFNHDKLLGPIENVPKGKGLAMDNKTHLVLLFYLALIYMGAAYPFLKNITITSFSSCGSTCNIQGTLDVYFSNQTWLSFGYKPNNFYWFNLYWQDQTGRILYQLGPFKLVLVSLQWSLLKHTEKFDTLRYNLTIRYSW